MSDMTAPNETSAEAKWTYIRSAKGWYLILHPEGSEFCEVQLKYQAEDICFRFNALSTLQRQYTALLNDFRDHKDCLRTAVEELEQIKRQLSEAEKELPSEEEVEKFIVKRFLNETGWSADQQEKENIQTHGKKHTKREVAAAKWMRSEASKTIAGLQSQLSDKEKEIERMMVLLERAYTYGKLPESLYDDLTQLLTPKQG